MVPTRNVHLRHHAARAHLAQPLGREDELAMRIMRAGVQSMSSTSAAVRRGLAPHEALGPRLPRLMRAVMLLSAVLMLATGVVAMLRSGLGAGPADVFLAALSTHIGIAHGTAGVLFAIALTFVAVALRRRPGPGTLVLALGVGPMVNVLWNMSPTPEAMILQWGQFGLGLVLVGLGIGAAIQAAWGPGNLELITDGLAARGFGTHSRIRIVIEVAIGSLGFILGGIAGPGTIVVALTIGPLVMLASSLWGLILLRWAAPTARPPLIPRLARTSRL
jgi:uncharacterized membrane protein YczE